MYNMKTCGCSFLVFILFSQIIFAQSSQESRSRREAYLRQILSVLPPEIPERGRVSPLDATWQDWLRRTGELPPDFDAMPSIPFLPDPLVLDEGGKNIPVKTTAQFLEKRAWMRKEIQHWITGTFPPPPDTVTAHIKSETREGSITIRTVELRFGPQNRASITVELYIPPGVGPFPVFMTPGSKGASWISISQAVRRGYIGCLYAACDAADDTEVYAEIWYPQYDFTRLMRRAWGAHRVIDYLYTLDFVDRDKIALAGLSRDGKQALMAAAFDERIKAVVPCSGGTGSEDPWRYTSDKFDNETIVQITTNFPHWIHPRMRFFVGREHKLPVDQNLLMALVAPRGLLVSSSITEDQGNPWGIEQNYLSARNVYHFLGTDDHIGLHLRHGLHSPAARDIEVYIDFFDYIFGRGKIPPPQQCQYNYSFSKWQGLSGETINPLEFPSKGIGDLLIGDRGRTITTLASWTEKKEGIRKRIFWGLGEEPSSTNPDFSRDYLRAVIGTPKISESAGTMTLPSGILFFPAGADGKPSGTGLPVIIYLHEYAYPTGFVRYSSNIINGFLQNGFAVLAFDQIGFGTRIEEGTHFYERFPRWSKMGRMVADTRSAVDSVARLGFIDNNRIYAAGYSLGGTVALYAAALDDRIAGVITVCGFTPMRPDTAEKGTEGIRAFSHLHGLIPRLEFFVGNESRIPYDYHEILACIAPRPVFVCAPTWDRDATFDDVRQCVEEAKKVYALYNTGDRLHLYAPDDYNRFSPDMQRNVFEWIQKNFR